MSRVRESFAGRVNEIRIDLECEGDHGCGEHGSGGGGDLEHALLAVGEAINLDVDQSRDRVGAMSRDFVDRNGELPFAVDDFQYLTALEIAEQADDEEWISAGRLLDSTGQVARKGVRRVAECEIFRDRGLRETFETDHRRPTVSLEVVRDSTDRMCLRDVRLAKR